MTRCVLCENPGPAQGQHLSRQPLCRRHTKAWRHALKECLARGACARTWPVAYCVDHAFPVPPPEVTLSVGHRARVLASEGAWLLWVVLATLLLAPFWLSREWRIRRAARARWLSVVRPIAYTLDGPGGVPIRAVTFPGRVGESYLVMAVGRRALENFLQTGDVTVLKGTYAPKMVAAPFYRYTWPDAEAT